MKHLTLFLALLIGLVLLAACSDKGPSSGTEDGGNPFTDTGDDTDTDSGTDTWCPGSEIDEEHDHALSWEPLPDGMECGIGCRQLNNTGDLTSYDVWGDQAIINERTIL